jgi:hypothetical protein
VNEKKMKKKQIKGKQLVNQTISFSFERSGIIIRS